MHTATSLATLIASHIEPDAAEHVLDALRPLNGQLITTRLLDKLPGGRVEWRLSRSFGWTELTNRAYRRDRADGIDLKLSESEMSVPLDVAWVERENGRYFEARRDRNAKRTHAIANAPLLGQLAVVMSEIEDLNAKLAQAKTRFVAFVDEAQLGSDSYALERACGLREAK